jgi:hypothetical protein
MLTSPINLNARPPWPMTAAALAALLVAGLLADPAILFLAPLAIPVVIWHRTRRDWLAADRNMKCMIEPRQQRQRRGVGQPPRRAKRRAPGSAPASQKRRQTIVVRYMKELR